MGALRNQNFTGPHWTGRNLSRSMSYANIKHGMESLGDGFDRPTVDITAHLPQLQKSEAEKRHQSRRCSPDLFSCDCMHGTKRYCRTCKGVHQPLSITWLTNGKVRTKRGNDQCWYDSGKESHNLFQFCAIGLGENQNLMRYWKKDIRTMGTRNWGDRKISTITVGPATASRRMPSIAASTRTRNTTTRGQGRHTTVQNNLLLLVTLALGELMMSEERVQSESRFGSQINSNQVWF